MGWEERSFNTRNTARISPRAFEPAPAPVEEESRSWQEKALAPIKAVKDGVDDVLNEGRYAFGNVPLEVENAIPSTVDMNSEAMQAMVKSIQTQVKSERLWFILNPRSRMMSRWDMFTLGALIFTALVTPFEVAFVDESELVTQLRLTPFSARKLLRLRNEYLSP